MFSKCRRFQVPSGLSQCLLLMELGVIGDALARVGESGSVESGQELQGEICTSLTSLIQALLVGHT